MTTRRLGWGLKCEYCQLLISNKIVPNRFVDVDCLNSRRCCLVKVLYSFDVRRFSNTVSVVNVTRRRIRTGSDPESLISGSDLELLISSESGLNEFALVEVVSPSYANDKGLESLLVSKFPLLISYIGVLYGMWWELKGNIPILWIYMKWEGRGRRGDPFYTRNTYSWTKIQQSKTWQHVFPCTHLANHAKGNRLDQTGICAGIK